MTDEPKPGRFLLRSGAEFVVIVTSILAAFALDAWWDSHTEEKRLRGRLQTLESELMTTRELVAAERARLESARQAVASILELVSPTADPVDADSLNTLMDLSFRAGTIELQGGSLHGILSSAELAAIEDPVLAGLLATWPNALAAIRTKSSMLEHNREMILEYLHARFPTLDITQKTGQMDRYPHSSFVASAETVQRDLRVEGLFGNRGMLIEDTDDRLLRLDRQTAEILALIRETLGR